MRAMVFCLGALISICLSTNALGQEGTKAPSTPFGSELVHWNHGFERIVLSAVIGENVAYYIQHYRRSDSARHEPLPSISVSDSNTGWNLLLVCVDLETGKTRWSRVLQSMAYLSADPRNDNCHIYGRRLITLRAEDGEVIHRTDVLSRSRLQGIVYPSGIVLQDDEGGRLGSSLMLVDAITGEKREILATSYEALSPDENYKIVKRHNSRSLRSFSRTDFGEIQCIQVSNDKLVWRHSLINTDLRSIKWVDANVFLLCGGENSISELTCLNGESGEFKWRHKLPEGIYRSDGHQLAGGAYPPGWAPVCVEDGRVIVVSAAGKLEVLDSSTGELILSFRPSRRYLCMPRISSNRLIVSTFDEIRSYALTMGEGGSARGRVIDALVDGPAEEVLRRSLRAISHDLDFYHAYLTAASALEELGRLEEALFFRARAIEISGLGYDAVLEHHLGLQKIVTLDARLSKHLVVHRGFVFFGTQDGRLIALNPNTYEHRVVSDRSREIRDISTQVFISDASSPIEESKISLLGFENPKDPKLTPEWRRSDGYTGRVVYWKGKFFRAEPEGTRVWDPLEKASDFHEGKVKHVLQHSKGWDIELSPAIQLGYGVGGVSKLDSNLSPVDWLVHLPEGAVSRLLINEKTFGAIMSSRGHPRMLKIFSHNGVLIRSVNTEGNSYLSGHEQFCHIGGGYLVSGRDWTWAHPNNDVPIVRLSPPGDSTLEIDPWWSDRYDWFSAPVIYGDHLFVISRYGSVYIFNSQKYCSISR